MGAWVGGWVGECPGRGRWVGGWVGACFAAQHAKGSQCWLIRQTGTTGMHVLSSRMVFRIVLTLRLLRRVAQAP